MRATPQPELVSFDCDGVLSDSETISNTVLAEAFAQPRAGGRSECGCIAGVGDLIGRDLLLIQRHWPHVDDRHAAGAGMTRVSLLGVADPVGMNWPAAERRLTSRRIGSQTRGWRCHSSIRRGRRHRGPSQWAGHQPRFTIRHVDSLHCRNAHEQQLAGRYGRDRRGRGPWCCLRMAPWPRVASVSAQLTVALGVLGRDKTLRVSGCT